MNDLFPLLEIDGNHYVDSRLIANDLQLNHSNFLETVSTYKKQIESKFGIIPFKTEKIKSRGRPPKFALFNEGHAISTTLLCRNSVRVVDVKLKITESFLKAKALLQQPTSTLDFLELTIKTLREQDTKLNALSEKLELLEAKSQTSPNYFIIVGFASMHKIKVGLNRSKGLGLRATNLCKKLKVPKEEVYDQRFGFVGSYPADVLTKVFQSVNLLK